ncbi:efflux RND transporter permease subunit [Helicovermis profundi]|uniref:Efflux RND transporter permease subunit n=1 Tax=Helicovermis profundi TaxID=3065157 RepID=A0AAU9EJ83_9FIRM|nr:efflux RND transporter permease subunit [Clostridia bacterium S502]
MNKIIASAIKERKVTILLSIIILLFGVYSYYFIPKQENPDTSSPAAQIVTIYPGASSSDIETLVTKPIEDAVAILDGINYIQSYSYDNVSVTVVMLNNDVDYDKQWDTLRTEIANVKTKLPSDAVISKINTDLTESAGIILSLSGDNYSLDQLNEFANQFKDKLVLVDGIKKINIDGKPDKNVIVNIKNKKLLPYDISIENIYNLIRAQNVIIPSGSIDTKSGKINLTVPKSFENLNDISNLIVYMSKENGSIVRLKDVSDIYFEYDKESLKFENMGESSLLISGYFKDNKNIVLVGKNVRDVIDTLKNEMPKDLTVNEVLFLPEDVDKSISNFITNLLEGILLVILVVLLGMGRRNAIIVSFTIPLSIAITFIYMYILKLDIQQVSIAALIISLGILVDNSIVISDAIQVKINEGIPNNEAAFLGAKEQAIPVFSSTLTTIAAFAPLAALPAEAGEFVKTLPEVVIVSLIASYVVAMLVTPALASKFFKKNHSEKDRLGKIKKAYTKLLNFNLNKPKTAIFTVIFVLIVSLSLTSLIKIKMFPYVDKNIMYINLKSDIGGDIDKTKGLVEKAEKLLMDEPEITSVTAAYGGGLPKFYMTSSVLNPSADSGQLLLKFDLSKTNKFSSKEIFAVYLQDKLDDNILNGKCKVNLLEINMPGDPIDIRVSGEDGQIINKISSQIFDKLLSIPGTMDVQNDKSNYRYEYKLDINNDLASSYGLTKYDIEYQINMALSGTYASIMKTSGKEYKINVKSNISDIDDILNLPISSKYIHNKILVKQFAKVKLDKQLSYSKRYNRESLVTVSARVRPEYGISNIQMEIENYINNELDTTGVKINYGGDSETISKYLSGLFAAGLLALVIVYVILLIQFNSLKQPLIILVTIPLSFIGVIAALLISRTHFTFTVGLGVASLFGIVVNNAILLIEYINRARKEGLNVRAACVDSVEKRMRPILLSTITTIFGLVPLILSHSSFFSPMSIALIGGLLISTILTLTIIPTIYYLLER